MNNLRFATIVHILVLLYKYKSDYDCYGKVLSSDYIAGSINVNPVVVRREIKILKDQGLLGVKKGKEGGFYLKEDPSKILFGNLYQLVNNEVSIGKLNKPNTECEIGKKMNTELLSIFHEVNEDIVLRLNRTSLKEFANQF
jgi:DNA-binding IscR family transcriptional regulator